MEPAAVAATYEHDAASPIHQLRKFGRFIKNDIFISTERQCNKQLLSD